MFGGGNKGDPDAARRAIEVCSQLATAVTGNSSMASCSSRAVEVGHVTIMFSLPTHLGAGGGCVIQLVSSAL